MGAIWNDFSGDLSREQKSKYLLIFFFMEQPKAKMQNSFLSFPRRSGKMQAEAYALM